MRSVKPQWAQPAAVPDGLSRTRLMQYADLEEVARIEADTFPNPWPVAYFRECLAAGYDCWVLEREQSLQAYAVMSTARGVAHLLNLCVHPSARGRGLGRRLLSQMVRVAQGRARSVILEVRVTNSTALALYRSMGFQEAGLRRQYYRSPEGGEDALVLVKPLPP